MAGHISLSAGNALTFTDNAGNVVATSTPLERDPTGHGFLTIRSNGTNIKGYWNATEILSYTGTITTLNSAVAHWIGRRSTTNADHFDGYLSRICFVDNGGSLAPQDFIYLNTEINEWVSKSQSAVKAVVDAGGTNSFMLDFDNATSLTTLGYDKSSKGNNWTLNNFSLTAGTTYDHMLDVPGNSYATLNPLVRRWGVTPYQTDSNANLKVTGAANTNYSFSSMPVPIYTPTYAEMTCTTNSSNNPAVYIASVSTQSGFPSLYTAYLRNGNILRDGTLLTTAATWTTGDIISVAADPLANTVAFYNNGTLVYTVTGAVFVPDTSIILFAGLNDVWDVNFGQAPLHASATYHSAAGGYFRYAPPTGFKALCQRNMPDPAILNPSSAMAHRFEAGSGIAAAIASDRPGWSDWMEWFKRTDTTESWKIRFSDDSSNMMAFDTNGAKAAWSAPSAGTYLGAAFRVGATYGVVTGTYSGDSTSNKNISHSLGKAPTCGIVKNESTGTWYVWHTKMTSAAYFTTLNSATPPAQSNTNTPWGTGNWSSTQFMVTNNATNNLNATGSTYRYILFADIDGLLALLGHTGNASTDGAFESSGHKSQLLIQKDLSATTGFYVWSDKIDTYNVTASYLLLNTNAGTAAATGVDICSNGTKYRSATIANAANPHMGISYSRTAGKYSLGR